jgi:hypothetical protein
LPVTNTEDLRRALLDTIDRKNIIIPNPPKNSWPPPVLLKYAGVKAWSAFARGAAVWGIEETGGNYQIAGYRTHRNGYWEKDPEKKIFPPRSTVEQVIDRMIAILQEPKVAKTALPRKFRSILVFRPAPTFTSDFPG